MLFIGELGRLDNSPTNRNNAFYRGVDNLMFFGRKKELALLKSLLNKNVASLVTVCGRRRIGKSSLIEHFGSSNGKYICIQGLGPDLKVTQKDQLENFANSLSQQTGLKKEHYENWTEAFIDLSRKTSKGRHIILLDEISWMAKDEPLFPLLLKNAWDDYFKKNPKLILVLCGSVSTWIEDNLLKSKTYLGRISLNINLKELLLPEINKFWTKQKYRLSSYEKMMILSITGGVPKYLEELANKPVADVDLARICFDESGFLFNEFENIFSDIFGKKAGTLKKMVRACLFQKLSPVELSKKLKIDFNSEFSNYLHILEISGFLIRDFYYKSDGSQSKLSHLRVSDNYLRFYLKYIEPVKDKIKHSAYKVQSLQDLSNIDTLMGFQFENLIMANRNKVISILGLNASKIKSASAYVQKANKKIKIGCQIDLLIHSSMDIYFLCEIKCKKNIEKSVINEVENKIKAIKLPRRSVVRPVLIYVGEIYPPHQQEIENYFHRIISFDEMLVED